MSHAPSWTWSGHLITVFRHTAACPWKAQLILCTGAPFQRCDFSATTCCQLSRHLPCTASGLSVRARPATGDSRPQPNQRVQLLYIQQPPQHETHNTKRCCCEEAGRDPFIQTARTDDVLGITLLLFHPSVGKAFRGGSCEKGCESAFSKRRNRLSRRTELERYGKRVNSKESNDAKPVCEEKQNKQTKKNDAAPETQSLL